MDFNQKKSPFNQHDHVAKLITCQPMDHQYHVVKLITCQPMDHPYHVVEFFCAHRCHKVGFPHPEKQQSCKFNRDATARRLRRYMPPTNQCWEGGGGVLGALPQMEGSMQKGEGLSNVGFGEVTQEGYVDVYAQLQTTNTSLTNNGTNGRDNYTLTRRSLDSNQELHAKNNMPVMP